MLKELEVMNPQGNKLTIEINPNQVVFISEIEIPSGVKLIDGTAVMKKATSLGLSNGMIFNVDQTVSKIKDILFARTLEDVR